MDALKQTRHDLEKEQIKNKIMEKCLKEIDSVGSKWLASKVTNTHEIVLLILKKTQETMKTIEKLADTRV